LHLLPLLARRQIRPQTLIGHRLAHRLPQRLGVDAQIGGDVRDRPTALERQPDATLKQLLVVLPRSRHGSGGSPLPRTASWNRGPPRNPVRLTWAWWSLTSLITEPEASFRYTTATQPWLAPPFRFPKASPQ